MRQVRANAQANEKRVNEQAGAVDKKHNQRVQRRAGHQLQETIMLANAVKTTAMAALLGLSVAGAISTSASANTIRTRCNGDDCVRLRCNDFGDDCTRVGYFERHDYDRVLPHGYTRAYDYYSPDTYVTPGYTYDNDYFHDYDDDYPG
jgi:hypothetical protein